MHYFLALQYSKQRKIYLVSGKEVNEGEDKAGKEASTKIAVIEHREPIISVLEEKGVKAAYMESQKQKRIEDEE